MDAESQFYVHNRILVIHVSYWISKSVIEIPEAEHVWFLEAEFAIPASGWANPTDHVKSEFWEINSIMKPAAMLSVREMKKCRRS